MVNLKDYISKEEQNVNEAIIMPPLLSPAVPEGLSIGWYIVLILLELSPILVFITKEFVWSKIEGIIDNRKFEKMIKELEEVPEFIEWKNKKRRTLRELKEILFNLDKEKYKNVYNRSRAIWDEFKEKTKI